MNKALQAREVSWWWASGYVPEGFVSYSFLTSALLNFMRHPVVMGSWRQIWIYFLCLTMSMNKAFLCIFTPSWHSRMDISIPCPWGNTTDGGVPPAPQLTTTSALLHSCLCLREDAGSSCLAIRWSAWGCQNMALLQCKKCIYRGFIWFYLSYPGDVFEQQSSL